MHGFKCKQDKSKHVSYIPNSFTLDFALNMLIIVLIAAGEKGWVKDKYYRDSAKIDPDNSKSKGKAFGAANPLAYWIFENSLVLNCIHRKHLITHLLTGEILYEIDSLLALRACPSFS